MCNARCKICDPAMTTLDDTLHKVFSKCWRKNLFDTHYVSHVQWNGKNMIWNLMWHGSSRKSYIVWDCGERYSNTEHSHIHSSLSDTHVCCLYRFSMMWKVHKVMLCRRDDYCIWWEMCSMRSDCIFCFVSLGNRSHYVGQHLWQG